MERNTAEHHASPKRSKLGTFLAVLSCILLAALLTWAIILYFTPAQPTVNEAPKTMNGPDMLLPSFTVAQTQVSNFAVTTDYDRIQGEDFHFSVQDQNVPDFGAEVLKCFNASGKIGTTGYIDTTLGILYLDYGIKSADCFTYLSLDTTQTGSAEAIPLSGIVTEGNGIHSVPYTLDTIPEYISVVGMVCVNNTYYYFMELHRQQLDVVSGTTQELAQLGIGNADSTGEPVALDGMWFAIAQPTIAEDENHSYFADAGYYVMSADGHFSYTPVKLAKQGTWYHMGGGEGTYEGTYQYDGITMVFHYTLYHETYFDDALGYETTRPVEINKTEQFPMKINQSCAEMCAVIPEHPTLGQIFAFEKCKSDDPIHAMLIKINGQF